MTKKAIELLHYITEAIDNNLGDTEINISIITYIIDLIIIYNIYNK